MVSLAMIIDEKLLDGSAEVALAKEHHPLHDVAFERAVEALKMCIAMR